MGTERLRASPLTIQHIADDVRSRWQRLKTDSEPWGLLAISLGGMVAMDWCSRFPYDFSNLVLINTSGGNLSHPVRRLQPPIWKSFVDIAKARNAAEREEVILGFNCNLALHREPGLHANWTRFSEEAPMPLSNAIRQLLAAMRFKAPGQLGVRTLFAASMSDKLTDPSCSWKLARRYSAPLVYHDVSGHDIPLDAPEWLCDQVEHWLHD